MFSQVSVCPRGGMPGGWCVWLGGGSCMAWLGEGTATEAGGTHPTGMHSCFKYYYIIIQECMCTVHCSDHPGEAGIPACTGWGYIPACTRWGCVYPSMHWAWGCVYPSMHWVGVCVSQHALGKRGCVYPSMHWVGGVCVSQHALGRGVWTESQTIVKT